MSSFTNYDDVSNNYDIYRRAHNMELLVAMTKHLTHKHLDKMSVLDAGCGTGNYSLGLLEAGVGHITLMDGSKGMLKTARMKTADYQSITDFHLGKLPRLSFPDASFDVVMFNQVLHHLEDTPKIDNCFQIMQETLKEAFRVLKTGGVIVIDTSSHEQAKQGFWYYALLGISEQYNCRLPSVSLVMDVLQKSGFRSVQTYVQPERLLMDHALYSDIEGALQPTWRQSDSSFAHATPEQIKKFCEKIINMKNQNTLEAFFDKCEKERLKVGQSTTIFACK